MKQKLAGIILLVVVILAAGGYVTFLEKNQVTVLNGYLGGEKVGLFEDEEVLQILKKRYHLQFDYAKAGSLDMVTEDATGLNYLFPSSQTALSFYEDEKGEPVKDEIIFNTPIVLYSHKIVVDALEKKGIVTSQGGIYYADMKKLTEMILNDTTWAEIGVSQLYGKVSVDTTNPAKSNSGNMFAALLANVINHGETVDKNTIDKVLPELQNIFAKLGYMENSSSDLFSQFLKMGVGAKPIIAGYESQILEFAAQNPKDYETLKEDVVIIYPSPTVWSTHVYIALDEAGKAGTEALLDEEIQQIAWEKHGFRTSSYGGGIKEDSMKVNGVADTVTKVMMVPDYPIMKRIIDAL